MNSWEFKITISVESYRYYFSQKQTTFTFVKEVCVEKVNGGGQEVSRLAGVVGLALNIVEPSV